MNYIIYQIRNKLNDKTYIGMHQTQNLDDSYMGSGKHIKRAIKKYGKDNFEKTILFVFDTFEEMAEKEKELVTEEFCKSSYNICPGGKGGFGYIHSLPESIKWKKEARIKADIALEKKLGKNWRVELANRGNNSPKRKSPFFTEDQKVDCSKRLNSTESQLKRNKKFKEIGHQKGEKNSNYGKCWITKDDQNKMIPKKDIDKWILLGYKKGRHSGVV